MRAKRALVLLFTLFYHVEDEFCVEAVRSCRVLKLVHRLLLIEFVELVWLEPVCSDLGGSSLGRRHARTHALGRNAVAFFLKGTRQFARNVVLGVVSVATGRQRAGHFIVALACARLLSDGQGRRLLLSDIRDGRVTDELRRNFFLCSVHVRPALTVRLHDVRSSAIFYRIAFELLVLVVGTVLLCQVCKLRMLPFHCLL